MSLLEIKVPDEGVLAAVELPAAIERLAVEAERRIHTVVEGSQDDPIFAFVPCDFRMVYRGLVWLTEAGLATGCSFCEWGSGFGVVAMLASSLRWNATGIELEPALVDAAERLAEDFALPVEFVVGSFVPEGSTIRPDMGQELAWLDDGAASVYMDLGLDPDDFDLTFAYPWPGEADVIYGLFDEHAARGALLLTYHGTEALRLHRKQ